MARVRTVLLGQFEDDNAERIVEALRAADIDYWVKRSGGLTRVLFAGDWGTRVFVDRAHLDEAERIAEDAVTG